MDGICPRGAGVLFLDYGTTETSRGLPLMDSFLDNLFDGLKHLEGRFIPRGWSAAIVAGSVLGFGALLAAIAFLLA